MEAIYGIDFRARYGCYIIWHTFKRRSNGTFLAVPNFPGAKLTSPGGFNDNGVVVGGYLNPGDCCGISHGFIYRNNAFAKLNYRNIPNTNTELVGIDKDGVIIGNHYSTGFLFKNGVFKDIIGPNGAEVTARGSLPTASSPATCGSQAVAPTASPPCANKKVSYVVFDARTVAHLAEALK